MLVTVRNWRIFKTKGAGDKLKMLVSIMSPRSSFFHQYPTIVINPYNNGEFQLFSYIDIGDRFRRLFMRHELCENLEMLVTDSSLKKSPRSL